jgi:hypothetical protein
MDDDRKYKQRIPTVNPGIAGRSTNPSLLARALPLTLPARVSRAFFRT